MRLKIHVHEDDDTDAVGDLCEELQENMGWIMDEPDGEHILVFTYIPEPNDIELKYNIPVVADLEKVTRTVREYLPESKYEICD